MSITRPLLVLVSAAALLVAACGDDDDATATDDRGGGAGRTVELQMVDNAFEPPSLEVERGETIKFVFENSGEVTHDAFVGDAPAQADHEDEMRAAEEMGHGEAEEDALTVEPYEIGELVYTFDRSGPIEIGCHQPGHYDSGMRISVTVT